MAELIGGDRRVDRRYELELGVRFRSGGKYRADDVGHGLTRDLSRSGLRLLTDDPPPAGSPIELWVEWPYLLQGVCRLELYIRGKVRHVSPRGTVVEIVSHEFRTCGERSFCEGGQSPSNSVVA